MDLLTLNLTEGFHPYNGKPIGIEEKFIYPGGEPHLVLELEPLMNFSGTQVVITCRCKSMDDLGYIYLAKKILDEAGFNKVGLMIPYLPGARQDRIEKLGECFTSKMYSEILNSLDFDFVTSVDSHSDVMPALIHRYREISSWEFRNSAIYDIVSEEHASFPDFMDSELVFVSPDTGAYKEMNRFLTRYYNHNFDLVHCTRQIDPETEELSKCELHPGSVDLNNRVCIIIDDICDSGRTSGSMARELKNAGARSVYLYATHGIFSFGSGSGYLEDIDGIYTTNSWMDNVYSEGMQESDFNKITILNI